MKLQQLRYLREVVRRGLNVSEAAEALYTSQPGISKQIRLLEDELGVQILVLHGKRAVDIGIITESDPEHAALILLPCYQWNRAVVTPAGHALTKEKTLTLEAMARYPLVTYDFAFDSDSPIRRAFDARGLKPNVALTSVDADVIKRYVELGVGIGIIAKMAFDPARDGA